MSLFSKVASKLIVLLEELIYFFIGPDPLAKFFFEDHKLYIGLVLWGGVWWHYFDLPCTPTTAETTRLERAYRRVARFHTTALLVLGVDLVVLSLLQTMGGGGFVGLMAMSGINVWLSLKLFGSDERKDGIKSFEAKSIYENLCMDMGQVTWIFIGQTILLLFLLCSVYVNYEDRASNTTYSFWLAAYMSVQMSGFFKRGNDSQLGTTWRLELWSQLRAQNSHTSYRKEGTEKLMNKEDNEIWWRNMMGFLVNSFYRDVIAFITPVLCMQSEDAVDFVQNCFALSYITTLDDMGDGQVFDVVRRSNTQQQSAGAGTLEDPLLESLPQD